MLVLNHKDFHAPSPYFRRDKQAYTSGILRSGDRETFASHYLTE